jgi:hypothetical protein
VDWKGRPGGSGAPRWITVKMGSRRRDRSHLRTLAPDVSVRLTNARGNHGARTATHGADLIMSSHWLICYTVLTTPRRARCRPAVDTAYIPASFPSHIHQSWCCHVHIRFISDNHLYLFRNKAIALFHFIELKQTESTSQLSPRLLQTSENIV